MTASKRGTEPRPKPPAVNDLIKHQTITEICAKWEQIKAGMVHAMTRLEELESELNLMLAHSTGGGLDYCFRYGASVKTPNRVVEYFEGHIWGALFAKSGVYQYLSVSRANELEEMLTKAQNILRRDPSPLGEISVANVTGVMRGLLDQLTEFVEGAIEEVYDDLRPPVSRLKTNDPNKGIGRTVILHHVVEAKDSRCRWRWDPRLNWQCENRIRAIDRVFHMLDGKGYVPKTHYGEFGDALRAITADNPKCETQYFIATAYMNGNLKIRFKRLDLLQRLNQQGGKRILGAATP
jgi:hypothetical protein